MRRPLMRTSFTNALIVGVLSGPLLVMSPSTQTPGTSSTSGVIVKHKLGRACFGATIVAWSPARCSGLLMNRFSAYVPGRTLTVEYGRASSIAAWIDWPGRTVLVDSPAAWADGDPVRAPLIAIPATTAVAMAA